jgi:hypothetical protein
MNDCWWLVSASRLWSKLGVYCIKEAGSLSPVLGIEAGFEELGLRS